MMKEGLCIVEICCTCSKWVPYQDDVTCGTCKPQLVSKNFDDKCDSWEDCEHENIKEDVVWDLI